MSVWTNVSKCLHNVSMRICSCSFIHSDSPDLLNSCPQHLNHSSNKDTKLWKCSFTLLSKTHQRRKKPSTWWSNHELSRQRDGLIITSGTCCGLKARSVNDISGGRSGTSSCWWMVDQTCVDHVPTPECVVFRTFLQLTCTRNANQLCPSRVLPIQKVRYHSGQCGL